MRRLAAATLSFAWMAVFAALSGVTLYAAEDGAGATVAAFHLPLSADAVEGMASRPALAGFCLGAAVVAALFATVLVSAVINAENDLRQGIFIADMAFGGASGLTLLALLATLMHPIYMLAAAAVVLAGLLVTSFFAMRAALAVRDVGASGSSSVVRQMALGAAASINVVRFPIERAAGVR
jgi:hypothetical protein